MAARAWAKLYQDEFDSICPELTPAQMIVYVALVTCRNSETMKTAPIGIGLLVAKTGLKRRTVFDALKALVNKGFVFKEKQGRMAVYSFPKALKVHTAALNKCIQPHTEQNIKNRRTL